MVIFPAMAVLLAVLALNLLGRCLARLARSSHALADDGFGPIALMPLLRRVADVTVRSTI